MARRIIECRGLKKYFPVKGLFRTTNWIPAVDGVDLYVDKGESLGIAGESGCGKTTLARCVLRLVRVDAGQIYFDGDLIGPKRRELKTLRRRTAIVYQDPMSSLDPRMTIADIVGEPLVVQGLSGGVERDEKVLDMLVKAGLSSDHMFRYPHEFSGGQKQRIAIARALVADPYFVVLDEPTSALDVSVQAQILNLLNDLKTKLNLSYMYISHDLSVARHLCDRIAILYMGKIVELASTKTLFDKPLHPYTQTLFSAILEEDPAVTKKRIVLIGSPPSPINPPPCRFSGRCWRKGSICKEVEPALCEVENGHYVACHFVTEKAP